MNRTGLLIAIGVGIVAGLILGLFPNIDLALSRRFFDPAAKAFLVARDETALAVRDGLVYVITALAAPAFIALAVKLILPRRPMLIPGRAVVFLIATLALAPGLVTNVILKDNWGRPRPDSVQEFAGTGAFRPVVGSARRLRQELLVRGGRGRRRLLDPRAAPRSRRRPGAQLAYAAALAFGAGVSGFRIAVRRALPVRRDICRHLHVSDHLAGARPDLPLAATRITDAQVERAIERLMLPGI